MITKAEQVVRDRQAADQFEALAKQLSEQGNEAAAQAAYEAAAAIDLADPELQGAWGGPLNGQAGRQRMFDEVMEAAEPDAIVETGTFRATSTEWMAKRYKVPILTCEINRRYFTQSRTRLAPFPHVTICHADSTEFLSALSERFAPNAKLLVYLDAHWLDRLPLAEEVGIIHSKFPRSVVMVDDFEVPLDDGYQFDNYGPGKRVDLNLLARHREEAHFFLPSLPAAQETGAKRGVCVLTFDPESTRALDRVAALRPADERDWAAARLTVRLESTSTPSPALSVVAAHVSSEIDRAAGQLAQGLEDRIKDLSIGVANAVANALLSPESAGTNPQEDAGWGPFLTEIRKSLAPLRAQPLPPAASHWEKDTIEIANAVVNGLLSPTVAGQDSALDARWGPFLTEIRRAVAPLHPFLVEHNSEPAADAALLQRLDRAIDAEVQLRTEVGRLEYRAEVAERAAKHAEQRAQQRDEKRRHEHELQQRLLSEFELESERTTRTLAEIRAEHEHQSHTLAEVRAENERLHHIIRDLQAMAPVSASHPDSDAREALIADLEQAREDLERLRRERQHIAASRWVRLGTAFGVSKLDRHLKD